LRSLGTLEDVVSASANGRSSPAIIAIPANRLEADKVELNIFYSERKDISPSMIADLLPIYNQVTKYDGDDAILCMIPLNASGQFCMAILPKLDDNEVRPIVALVGSFPSALARDCRTILDAVETYRASRDGTERFNLSAKDIAIAKFLSSGHSSKVISHFLHLKQNTVESYIKDMMKRSGAKNRCHLVAMLVESRIHKLAGN
jgi:DNA-binding CsgD family transcriptional regulator